MNDSAKVITQFALCTVVFAVGAFVCAAIIVEWMNIGKNPQVMVLTATVSGAGVALASWIFFTSGGKTVKIWKGAVTGILAGSVSHFFVWYLLFLFAYLQGEDSLTFESLDRIGTLLMFPLLSLALVGWITVPVGALIGAALALAVDSWLNPLKI